MPGWLTTRVPGLYSTVQPDLTGFARQQWVIVQLRDVSRSGVRKSTRRSKLRGGQQRCQHHPLPS